MIEVRYNLNMVPDKGSPIHINVSQNDDKCRTFIFKLYSSDGNWTAPASATATIEGRKDDGKFFSFACTYSNGEVTVIVQQQMVAVAGKVRCKLKLVSGAETIESAPFYFVVNPKSMPVNADMSKSDVVDAVAKATQKIVDQVAESIPEDYVKLNEDVSGLKSDIFKHGVPAEMFGAVGDGITDDTKALQNAFNSEFNTIILSGIYYISETLTISKSIKKIYGGGKIFCLVKYDESNKRVPQGSVSKTGIQITKGAADVTISNIHIEGYTADGANVGIECIGSNTRIRLEHLKIRYFGIGISFSYCWCNYLEDIEFKYYSYAIKFLKTEETDISCYEVSIKDCVFLYKTNDTNANWGIYSDGILSNLSINNSAFDSVNRCLEVKKTSFVNFFNCGFERYENILLVRENTDSFINIFGGHSYLPTGITKEDFHITSGTLNCVGVFFTPQTKFLGNTKRITLIGCNVENN